MPPRKPSAWPAAAGLVGRLDRGRKRRTRTRPLYAIGQAVERIAAAAQAARALRFPVRAHRARGELLRGNPDLDDTIKRLQAYEKAGADVLFAPGLPDLAAVKKVCAALSKPFNFMVGIRGKFVQRRRARGSGVRRISLATSLYRAAMSGLADPQRK